MKQSYPDDSRNDVLDFVPERAQRILDVGCWQGAFGRELRLQQPTRTVHGVEIDSHAADVARERVDEVWNAPFEEVWDELDGPYDLIVFNDVLEHMVDPWTALAHSSKLLTEDGLVLVSLPNVRHIRVTIPLLFQGNWTYTETGLLDRTHLRFFTRSSAMTMVEGAGLDVREVTLIDRSNRGVRGRILSSVCKAFGESARQELLSRHIIIVAARRVPQLPRD